MVQQFVSTPITGTNLLMSNLEVLPEGTTKVALSLRARSACPAYFNAVARLYIVGEVSVAVVSAFVHHDGGVLVWESGGHGQQTI